eukprot:TRINITY_DN8145_c0_g3_i1.p1 TRINITY_DN8145_c0_g3~~TRINITY_DN8145_c0_g3_i1.p1  ORF type:complete len:639 (-),score=78.14 TRINITY_DN8145_c0_g3_i1:421-2337(-)
MSGATSLAPGLSRKVKKVLDIKSETPEFISSLETLSEFYADNSAQSRRSLRSTVEKRGLKIHQELLQQAEEVFGSLNKIQTDLNALTKSCGAIGGALADSKNSTSQLLTETEKLKDELSKSQKLSQLADTFLKQYRLSESEVNALKAGAIDTDFFEALERVRQIHSNCRALLHGSHQRAGIELMDEMAMHQETAYERLCRWVQAQCRALGDSDIPEVPAALSQATKALRERPVLFKYCAEEVSVTRHNSLFERFINALTRGPRPIEMHAHDPRRYVGDMLAWTHQSLASERELLVAMFGEEEDAGDLSVPELLDKIFESIARPLKVRIEQVLFKSPPLILCFQLSQLLQFYYFTMLEMLPPQCALLETVRGCRDMSQRVFFEQLKSKGDKLVRYPPPPPTDLSPPPQILEALQQVLEIVKSHEQALRAQQEVQPFDDVLKAALDPILVAVEKSSDALSPESPSRLDEAISLDPSSRLIFLINCFTAIQTPLLLHDNSQKRATSLGESIQAYVGQLVNGEVYKITKQCGLGEVVERMREFLRNASNRKMAEETQLRQEVVADVARQFFALVSSPDVLPEFPQLQVPRVRSEASSMVSTRLASMYDELYGALEDPSNGYAGGAAVAKHSPENVRTILGVL